MKEDYSSYFNYPEKLAEQVLKEHYRDEIKFPVNPFEILKKQDVVYQFNCFDELEGIYIVPEDSDDIAVVGINCNRPIQRQRFTAAHELCHHIKDRKDIICPKRHKDDIEKFADKFAAALLMPKEQLKVISEIYMKDGYVEFDDILLISIYFGVSFQACTYRLAYLLNRVEGDIDSLILKQRINQYKPDLRKKQLGYQDKNTELMAQIIDSYEFCFRNQNIHIWEMFKRDFVYNDNRLEGVKITRQEVAEIITDLRLYKSGSQFCNERNKNIIEVAGLSTVYDYIIEEDRIETIFSIRTLHKKLYQFSPKAEYSGILRNSNPYVKCAKFETVDCNLLFEKLNELDENLNALLRAKENLTFTQYIKRVLFIHHELTVIHPFSDGNGRITRAINNWLFWIKGLPPIYINYREKNKYYDALKNIDIQEDYNQLTQIYYERVLRSIIYLNSSPMG